MWAALPRGWCRVGEFWNHLRMTYAQRSCHPPGVVQGTPFAPEFLSDESPSRTWGSGAEGGTRGPHTYYGSLGLSHTFLGKLTVVHLLERAIGINI